MKTKTFALIIISLLAINLRAQESVVPKYFERAQRTLKTNEPLLFFDDNKIQNLNQIGRIDTSNIQKIKVIKVIKENSDSLIKLYGPEAQNGLIFIYSKEFIAKKWFKEFAIKNENINKIVDNPEFNYKDYKIYLNDELLKTNFFDGLNEKLKSQKIESIEIEKYKSDDENGIIHIRTKPNA